MPPPRRSFLTLLAAAALAIPACNTPQHAADAPADQPSPAKPEKEHSTARIERITLASGLVIEDLQIGSGDICLPDSKVRVNYTCRLPDGTLADSSGDGAVELSLPRMIRGWRDGIPGMKVGGTRRLTIPPDLGYGSRSLKDAKGIEVIPPGSVLTYEIDLLGLIPTAPTTEPASPQTPQVPVPESPATSHGG